MIPGRGSAGRQPGAGKATTSAENRTAAANENKQAAAASDADRRWFAAHPLRSHRVRAMFKGEFPTLGPAPDGHRAAVVVQQIAPCLRARTPVFLIAELPLGNVTEHIAAALCDILREGVPGVIAWSEMHRRVLAYAEASARRPS